MKQRSKSMGVFFKRALSLTLAISLIISNYAVSGVLAQTVSEDAEPAVTSAPIITESAEPSAPIVSEPAQPSIPTLSDPAQPSAQEPVQPSVTESTDAIIDETALITEATPLGNGSKYPL